MNLNMITEADEITLAGHEAAILDLAGRLATEASNHRVVVCPLKRPARWYFVCLRCNAQWFSPLAFPRLPALPSALPFIGKVDSPMVALGNTSTLPVVR